MPAAIFSPMLFLCILLFKETFLQVQALPQWDPGPRSQTHLKSMVSKFFEEKVAAWRVGS